MMSPTVWAVTFGGTLLAAATIIALACCRAAVREDRAVKAVHDALETLTDTHAQEIEMAFLRGAVAALQKTAGVMAQHEGGWEPEEAVEYLRRMADQIILDRPAVWS